MTERYSIGFIGYIQVCWLAHATMRNINQNLFFAFVYNSAGVPVAAGVLYPFFGILLSPIIAAAAMSLSSVSVVGNALRLRPSALLRRVGGAMATEFWRCRKKAPGDAGGQVRGGQGECHAAHLAASNAVSRGVSAAWFT